MKRLEDVSGGFIKGKVGTEAEVVYGLGPVFFIVDEEFGVLRSRSDIGVEDVVDLIPPSGVHLKMDDRSRCILARFSSETVVPDRRLKSTD